MNELRGTLVILQQAIAHVQAESKNPPAANAGDVNGEQSLPEQDQAQYRAGSIDEREPDTSSEYNPHEPEITGSASQAMNQSRLNFVKLVMNK